MCEAELHVLQARLRGGLLNKARRGALKAPLPVGLCDTPQEQVVLDPDQQVQQAIRLFFATFAQTGSAWGTVRRSPHRGCPFRGGYARGCTRAISPGDRCCTATLCTSCTIPAMLAPSPLDAPTPGKRSRGTSM